MTAGWSATRFDGRQAAGTIVLVRVDGDAIVLVSRSGLERIPLSAVDVGERFEHAPQMLRLPGGETLAVEDPDHSLPLALRAAGIEPSWVVRLQRAWPSALGALVLLVAIMAWAYIDGLPIAARHAVDAVPLEVEQRMGENILALLDAGRLEPSALSQERRDRLDARFRETAAKVAPGVPVRLEFRSGAVNAFAIPGGTVVLFDELVELAKSDDAVLGVLGHELGHVVHRHSLRQLAQALGATALASLVWGDFSTVAANVPVILGVMRYGRGFEEEADDYAIAALRAMDVSPRPLHDFFVALRDEPSAKADDKGERPRARRRPPTADADDEPPAFLSTHPSTQSRLARLRKAIEAHEARSRPAR